jgi:hypothetical protein
MIKNTILALAAVAALSTVAAPAFAAVPQSLVPTSASDKDNSSRYNTAALDNTTPQSLVPTSAGDKASRQQAA